MRRQWMSVAVLFGVTLLAGATHAGSDPVAVEGTVPAPSAPNQGQLPLVLSIRALSVSDTPFTETGELGRVRASTGAGTSTWPAATTSVGRGVYISVMPGCIPGVDEPYWPGSQRRRR
jgi:hypothetical protein